MRCSWTAEREREEGHLEPVEEGRRAAAPERGISGSIGAAASLPGRGRSIRFFQRLELKGRMIFHAIGQHMFRAK